MSMMSACSSDRGTQLDDTELQSRKGAPLDYSPDPVDNESRDKDASASTDDNGDGQDTGAERSVDRRPVDESLGGSEQEESKDELSAKEKAAHERELAELEFEKEKFAAQLAADREARQSQTENDLLKTILQGNMNSAKMTAFMAAQAAMVQGAIDAKYGKDKPEQEIPEDCEPISAVGTSANGFDESLALIDELQKRGLFRKGSEGVQIVKDTNAPAQEPVEPATQDRPKPQTEAEAPANPEAKPQAEVKPQQEASRVPTTTPDGTPLVTVVSTEVKSYDPEAPLASPIINQGTPTNI